MDIFKIIRDEDLGLAVGPPVQRRERQASRIVIFDSEQNVALLNVTKKHYHKLPGGGFKKTENALDALKREVMEEAGCEVEHIKELGIIEEYRERFGLHQVSYCFIGQVKGEKKSSRLEQDEIDNGFQQCWVKLDQAIEILESEAGVEDYEGKFIQMRDLLFLKEANKYLQPG